MAATAKAVSPTTEDKELRESLQVVQPDELVDWLNMMVYGDAGAGKTYLGGTADDDPRTSPLLVLDIEGGMTTLRRHPKIDVVTLRTTKAVEDTYNRLFKSIKVDSITKQPSIYYKTVMIDSMTELADLDMKIVMKEAYSRNPDKVDVDVPSPREWGKVRSHMRAIVRAFRDLPCNVIYVAQVGKTQEEGQPIRYYPGFSGKLAGELPGFMDIVGYLYAETEPGSGVITRKLQVASTRRIVAKDRTSSLGDVIENPTIPMMWDLIHV